MADLNEKDLIREYADRNSEAAFAQLVHRHINLVYSVALRFTGNAQDAQDVTQAVFIILAKKSPDLRQRTTLTGWLYETTRFTARQQLRTRVRQQARDQEAYMQSTLSEADTDKVWKQLAPMLEDAMTRLNEKERALLALRFFENKTGAETAALLGIQEWAAHKSAARALEKLRKFFTKRGVSSTTNVIAAAISANSVHAAPATLAKSVTVVAITKGAAASASTLTLIQGAMKIMAWTKMKTAIGAAVVLLLASGTATTMIVHSRSHTATKTNLPKSAWVNAGYGAPAATIQTIAWALHENNGPAMFACLSAGYQAEFRKDVAKSKPGTSAEEYLLQLWRPQMDGSSGLHILETQSILTNEVLLDIALQGGGRTGDHWIKLQKFGDDWKVEDFDPKGKNGRTGLGKPEYGGLGVALDFDRQSHAMVITNVLPNSPASQAGLVAGLLLQKIDGTPTAGKSLSEIVFLGRGVVGTKVVLELVNPALKQTNTVQLTRKKLTPAKR